MHDQPITQRKFKECTCLTCLKDYILGVNGTVNGCDECEGIHRDIQGRIIYEPDNVFIREVKE